MHAIVIYKFDRVQIQQPNKTILKAC